MRRGIRDASDGSSFGNPTAMAVPERPTSAERTAAMQVLEHLRSSHIIRESSGKNEPAVVACALALKSGEDFDSDRDAKRRFGVAPSTNVRQRWLPRLMLLDAADARKAAIVAAIAAIYRSSDYSEVFSADCSKW